MGIQINQTQDKIHLYTKTTSYVMETYDGELLHSYWGDRIELSENQSLIPVETRSSFSPNPNPENKSYTLDILPRELPDFGRSDYRNPAIRLNGKDGSRITELKVKLVQIMNDKEEIQGLPSTYGSTDKGEVETLCVTLEDQLIQVEVKLFYSVFENENAITRRVVVKNNGSESVKIDRLMSSSIDFYHDSHFEVMNLYGSWARERHVSRLPVGHSTHVIDSKRGASSSQQNPLIMLLRPETTEMIGQVYSMNLIYSGSFKGIVEVCQFGSTRMQMGLNDFDFEWTLASGESFYSPEAVLVYSNEGLNGMSKNYHALYMNHLIRGNYQFEERPLLINNWEATYFTFNEEKIHGIGDAAAELGLEMMVLDDGWFGIRNSDLSGLGDWIVNKDKLPNGLKGIGDYMNNKGLAFGLWFEPEMISPDSDLYRQHPDWCLHVEGRQRGEGRNQLVIDMSREDVCQYLTDMISDILRNNPIGYVKWDMNRHMTHVGSALLSGPRQGEVTHRYMLGLYQVIDTLVCEFPEILFESCSGGGARFDPGMLYYMPQTWTSDDTDAYERQFIQYGTSLAYPQSAMAAHVSVVPNHQTNRSISLKTRGYMSMMANLSYELDLNLLDEEDKTAVMKQIKLYKEIRRDIQFGQMYRLKSPYDKSSIGNDSEGLQVLIESEDGERYYLFVYKGLMKPSKLSEFVRTFYMKPGQYQVQSVNELFDKYHLENTANGPQMIENDLSAFDLNEKVSLVSQLETIGSYDSTYLNNRGLVVPAALEDFDSYMFVMTREKSLK